MIDELSWLQLLAAAWVVVEAIFYVYATEVLHPKVNKLTDPPACRLGARQALERIIYAVFIVKEVYPFSKLLEGWFGGADINDIYEGNVRSFLAWSGWHKRLTSLNDEEHAILDDIMVYIEKLHGLTFPPGFNPMINHKPFSLEPVSLKHAPLSFYVFNKAMNSLAGLFLFCTGFKRATTSQGVNYWHRPAHKDSQKELPLVFFHGVGPGLWLYLPFLARLSSSSGRAAVYVELPHVATSLTLTVPHWTTLVKAVEELMDRHGIPQFCVAGHSFGSIVAGWMVRELPQRVKKVVLLDPVCLLLCMPEVTFGFFNGKQKGRPPKSKLEEMADISKEITVANMMARNFWWYEKVLWGEDIQCPVIIALSGKDHIVPAAAVKLYIDKLYPGSRMMYWPELGHGHVLALKKQQDEVIAVMKEELAAFPEPKAEEEDAPVPMALSREATAEMVFKLTKSLSKRMASHHGDDNDDMPLPMPFSREVTAEVVVQLTKSLSKLSPVDADGNMPIPMAFSRESSATGIMAMQLTRSLSQRGNGAHKRPSADKWEVARESAFAMLTPPQC